LIFGFTDAFNISCDRCVALSYQFSGRRFPARVKRTPILEKEKKKKKKKKKKKEKIERKKERKQRKNNFPLLQPTKEPK
jgi:hypothetical protein